jgi:hypothetical protein
MAASVVILLEPLWNGSIASQAIGRVLRMGRPEGEVAAALRGRDEPATPAPWGEGR